jgi:hypothetical protein
MTDPVAPEVPAAPVEPASLPPAPPKKGLNVFGLIALILGVIGFVFAVTPASAVAWIFAIPAIVLGIIGLTRKNKGKGTSIAGLSVGAVAWLVSIIVTVALAASSVVSADNSTTVTNGSGSKSHSTTAPANNPGIGDTVTNHAGVAFTVSSVACGLTSAPDDIYGTDAPKGQFCLVTFTVKNGSNASINLGSDSLTGQIGTASYDADDKTDHFGSDTYLSTLNPGLSVVCTVYVDVPTGQKLSSVKLGAAYSFGVGDVTIDVG